MKNFKLDKLTVAGGIISLLAMFLESKKQDRAIDAAIDKRLNEREKHQKTNSSGKK